MKKKYYPIAFIFLLFNTGCSLFFGNIKPSDEKSSAYHYLDLSRQTQDWFKINPKDLSSHESNELSQADVSFQSKKGRASISINSVCTKKPKIAHQDHLKALAQELFLGLSQVEVLQERTLKVSQTEAYEITIQGTLHQTQVMMRVVLLEKNSCTYDLIFVSDPLEFKRFETDFNRFVDSFELTSSFSS